ncbi:MAG TPA: BlaI/MecI/CopY family transcriptional regulator [Pyrinomonadaceae bacterium]|jgi:predicted transcriptional regulator
MKIPGFTLLGFKRPREVVCETLGKLERKVMEETWRRKEVSVRDVCVSFGEQIAYTTVMTTLDRLHKKGLLDRRKSGRAFLYSPRVSRAEMEQGVAKDVIEGLLGSDSASGVEPVLACIVDAVSERDRELLDELDRLVREKRRELRRQD